MRSPPLFPLRGFVWGGVLSLLAGGAGWCSEPAAAVPELPRVSFRNDVEAVLAKAGCNQGTCHGNAGGKGGFRLSLRGFDPKFDYAEITRGMSGRRINTTAVGESLLLRKPTMQVAHGGGRRFNESDEGFRILRDWIAAGAPSDLESAPRLTQLEAAPRDSVLTGPDWTASLHATATFADGSTRDVTTLAVYEPSQPIVEISPDGEVRASQPGEVVIGVRYLNRTIPVRLAFIEQRAEFQWSGPVARTEIDRIVFDRLKELQITPTPLCDDVTFLRRACLDLLGRLPSVEEARGFAADANADKRSQLVEALLDRPEFARHWALKWSDLLRNEEKVLDRKGVENLAAWLTIQFGRNRPLDEVARELISATGSTYANPPANYYRSMRDPIVRAESAAQVFLGVRLQCAKCHNHPFDRWTQDDYYGWASLFGGIDYKIVSNNRPDKNDKHQFDGEQIVYLLPEGGIEDPRTGKNRSPRMLGDKADCPSDVERLDRLAGWVTDPANPFFARTQANRLWAQVMGRGIVDPVDDFRLTNPASPPGLLEWLAKDFQSHGYDVRHTLRTILNSAVYQLDTLGRPDLLRERNFACVTPRRLPAEQLLDILSEAMEQRPTFNGYPRDVKALELAGVQAVGARQQEPSEGDRFLTMFGKPMRLQSCECERSDESTLAQTFTLVSGSLVNRYLTAPENRIGRLLREGKTREQVIEELYWGTLSRGPTDHELSTMLAHFEPGRDERAALEDVAWGLVNSNEFLLRR